MTEGQPPKTSAVESILNVLIGYATTVGGQLIVFPLFGMNVSLGKNALIGLIFTVIGAIRVYLIRRAFNWIQIS